MRRIIFVTTLIAFSVSRAEAGGPDYWIDSALVHKVETDPTKIVFTVSGPCAIYVQDRDRDDKPNRVDTSLKCCVITITKEAFKKSSERTLMTWEESQAAAKALEGKTAFMQLSGSSTFNLNRIESIQAAGMCYFKPESDALMIDCVPSQREAFQFVKKLGGTLELDQSRKIVGIHLWNGARAWHGIQRTTVTDSDLEKLKGIATLTELDLEGTQITGDGLKHLRNMKNLRRIRLDRTKITDAGLANLAGLTTLKELLLWETQITDVGLMHLSRLTNLQELWIDDTKITDKGLACLKGLTNLRILFMQGTNVTDAGLQNLWELKNLERVLLHQTYCTREGVNELAKHLPKFEAYEVSTRAGKSN
jgi:hypothetical protein